MLSPWKYTGAMGLCQFVVFEGRVAHRRCNYCYVVLSCQGWCQTCDSIEDLLFFPCIALQLYMKYV